MFSAWSTRTALADALNHAGRRAKAEARFREAEAIQSELQPAYPLLYSLRGFRYCDLLLTEAERAAWQVTCSGGLRPPEDGVAHERRYRPSPSARRRGSRLPSSNLGLLDIALNHLTLGSTALYAAILEGSSLDPCRAPLQHAVDGLRRAGTQHCIPTRSSPAPGCGFSRRTDRPR